MNLRDLELSTSLDVQAIDSKVDNLVVEHASSQHINVNHFERIQQEVQSVGAVQHVTHETTLGISKSTDKIHDTLQDIQTSQASSHQTTRCQLESLDARIAAMQRSILNIPHQKGSKTRRRVRKPDPRRHVSQKEHSLLGVYSELEQRIPAAPAIPTQLNRLVDIAVTARHRCGKWHLEALAIPDSAFEAADFGTRLRMVKYLQDLRLLLWLLCRKEYSRDWLLNPSGLPRSELISEARFVSSWSLATLSGTPPMRSSVEIQIRAWIPWNGFTKYSHRGDHLQNLHEQAPAGKDQCHTTCYNNCSWITCRREVTWTLELLESS